MFFGSDSTMENTITADLGSQDSNDGGANVSILIYTTTLHSRVCNLASTASNKVKKIVLKETAGFTCRANTKIC
jgi:hypothetical protein